MSLQLQMIGTGSAFAKTFYNNNALIYLNDFTLLIDCGYTAPRALFELGISLDQIDAVLITHIHADHVGGLEELAFQCLYTFKRRIKLLVPFSIEHMLWDHSLRGGLENKDEGISSLNDYFDVIPLAENTPISIRPDLTVRLLPTDHIRGKKSYSLLLNDRLFYSADARFDLELLMSLHIKGCDHFLHDCQLHSPGHVHASLEELLTLPVDLQQKTWLMHYSDQMPDYIGKTGHMRFIEPFKRYTF
ncbi:MULTISPECIES: MBL fold metallo-hydrolase [Paenibacillus]|uniref:MBL fold metallo-hydrolase n=1 Tax=Paenibacillus validus TaxID=44253 RepID=A0A7X3CTR1_9BACL|nr:MULTISPECIES: MBL fold metallo-hydrolase [Paenibacillus]MUG73075.1 MBL fold metallo-hydrolase [Paenibacillus validus]